MFKVGLRVTSNGTIDSCIVHGMGTIIEVKNNEYLIEWDEYHEFMHTGGGAGKYGHCWWCYNTEELIPVSMENV